MNHSSLVLIFLFGLYISGFSQTVDLQQRIPIIHKKTSLENMIHHLQNVHKIKIGYNPQQLPLQAEINIQGQEVSLQQLLTIICGRFDLTYKVIDNLVVLRPKAYSEKAARISTSNTKQEIDRNQTSHRSYNTCEKLQSASWHQAESVIKPLVMQYKEVRKPDAVTKNYKAKRSSKINFSCGPAFIVDFPQYYLQAINFTYASFETSKATGVGVKSSIRVGNNLAASVTGLYSSKKYRYSYNHKPLDTNDPVAFPKHTDVKYEWLETAVGISYTFYRNKYFSLNVSPAVNTMFLLNYKENTGYLNGENKETEFIAKKPNDLIWGASAGIGINWKINKNISLALEPGFVQLFDKVESSFMKKDTQNIRVQSSLIFHLFR